MLKPDQILPAIGINMSLGELLKLNYSEVLFEDQSLRENGVESSNSLANLRIYLFIALAAAVVVIIMLIVAALWKKARDKIMDLLKKTIKGFFWNNTIKTILISYLPQCIAVTGAISLQLSSSKSSPSSSAVNTLMMLVLIVIPFIFLHWLLKHKDQLRSNKELESKFLELYSQLRLPFKDQNRMTVVCYQPFFLLRRFLFCLFPLLLSHHKVC